MMRRVWRPLQVLANNGHTWTKSSRCARKPSPNFSGYSDIAVMPDGSIGMLYERGDLEDASRKSERYDEAAFVVVPFTTIHASLPPSPPGGSTP